MSKATLYFRNGVPAGMVDLFGAPITTIVYETTTLEELLSFNGHALPYAEVRGKLISYWTGTLDIHGIGVFGLIDILPHPADGGGGGLGLP